MHKLGISVYPDKTPRDEVYTYLEKAAEYLLGFEYPILLAISIILLVFIVFNKPLL